jgi:hypothetical protein
MSVGHLADLQALRQRADVHQVDGANLEAVWGDRAIAGKGAGDVDRRRDSAPGSFIDGQ